MIPRVVFSFVGLLLGVAVTIGGLYVWTYLFGNPDGSLFDNDIDAYNVFERVLIGCVLVGVLLGWWFGGKVRRARKK